MIWIFLFYILPFLLSVIIGYKLAKLDEVSKAEFIEYCLYCLIPIFNIVVIFNAIAQLVEDSDAWKRLKNSKL